MKHIDSLLGIALTDKIQNMESITAAVSKFFGQALEGRVWPVIRLGTLTLYTDDPNLNAQGRFVSKSLCKAINQELDLKLARVNIKLIQLPMLKQRPKATRRAISKATQQQLIEQLQGIEDEEYRAALQGLAKSLKTHDEGH